MRLLLKIVVFLLLVAALALAAYALLFDLPPPERDIVVPVETR
jgi:hypothetical protein